MKNKLGSIVTGVLMLIALVFAFDSYRQGVGYMYANGWWSPDSTTWGW